ncbi:hypothetical protein AB0K40_11400 [Nonomuraea bangladeshensis]|uniref:Uncharacterized protein n=1 Tax=Nonomuraea bangladeshensis TaxID=404385 RepID=A0ABV3H0M7_9ACTN
MVVAAAGPAGQGGLRDVGGDPGGLESIPLGAARELLERVLRETAAERARSEDDD